MEIGVCKQLQTITLSCTHGLQGQSPEQQCCISSTNKQTAITRSGPRALTESVSIFDMRTLCRSTLKHSHIRGLSGSSGSNSNNSKKQIAVIGGGLGGLTAARVLQKHGFNPVVFEREPSQEARQQGGTLDLHPHSGRICLHAVHDHIIEA